jgi:next to BRCA1 gene 1 protein
MSRITLLTCRRCNQ